MQEFHRLQDEPQRRINAISEFVQDFETGKSSLSVDKFYKELEKESKPKVKFSSQFNLWAYKSYRKYAQPLYVRDKNNRNILRPYNQNLIRWLR